MLPRAQDCWLKPCGLLVVNFAARCRVSCSTDPPGIGGYGRQCSTNTTPVHVAAISVMHETLDRDKRLAPCLLDYQRQAQQRAATHPVHGHRLLIFVAMLGQRSTRAAARLAR